MKISYFIDQYPRISHASTRREVFAPECQGCDVQRIALGGWNDDAVDVADIREFQSTRYALQQGLMPLLRAMLKKIMINPHGLEVLDKPQYLGLCERGAA